MAYGKGFGGGFGGNQMQQLMKQAQKMQEDMQKAQAELDDAEVEGVAGGGLVKVVVNGKKVVKAINVDTKACDPEDTEMLEDLIMAALGSAYEAADKLYEEKMGPYAKMGGMI